ncbi:MAG: hypothetical protein ACJ8AH_25195 [Stellaceae bacterium]|jgi:hypothetical protein
MIEIILIQAIAGTVIVASVGIAAALAWRVHHRRENRGTQPSQAALGDRNNVS